MPQLLCGCWKLNAGPDNSMATLPSKHFTAFFFLLKGSCSPSWPATHYTVETIPDLQIPFPFPPKCWDSRHALPHLAAALPWQLHFNTAYHFGLPDLAGKSTGCPYLFSPKITPTQFSTLHFLSFLTYNPKLIYKSLSSFKVRKESPISPAWLKPTLLELKSGWSPSLQLRIG